MSQETLEHLVQAMRHMYLATSSLFRPEIPVIAKIPMYGPIQFQATAPKFPFGSSRTVITPQYVEQRVKRALDDHVVGFIFDINSPGGEVVPSRKIAKYIHELDVQKVALVENVAASGGYLIASACNSIVVDECSINASIGVIPLANLDFSELMKMFGIKYRGLKAGEHKDMGNPFVEMPEDHRKIFQGILDYTHRIFIEDVARYRHMEEDEVRAVATGRIYVGDALELGLVDMFGGMKEAKEYIKAANGLKQARVIDYGEKAFPFPFSGLAAALGYAIGEGIAKNLIAEVKSEISGRDLTMY